jgi:hypothetical protein
MMRDYQRQAVAWSEMRVDLSEAIKRMLAETSKPGGLVCPLSDDQPAELPTWIIDPRYKPLIDPRREPTPLLANEAVIGVGVFEDSLVRTVCYRGRGVGNHYRFTDLEPGFWLVTDCTEMRLSPFEVRSLVCGQPPWKHGTTTVLHALDVQEHLRVLGPVAFAEVFGYEPPKALSLAEVEGMPNERDSDNLPKRILDFMSGREPMNSIAVAAGVLGYTLWEVPYDDMMMVKRELEKLRERGEVRLDAGYCLAEPVASKAKPCPDCNDTGMLAGYGFGVSINACDRPCPCGATPKLEQARKDEGPAEWTIVRREVRPSTDGSYSAEHVTVQVGKQIAVFRVVAHHDPDYYETTVIQQQPNPTPWGQRVLVVRHEACVDMAIARLLCGLRDGTVQP